jgi:uncharacterized repeat protein (TIGR01451 family)
VNATTTADTKCGKYTNTATGTTDGLSDVQKSADVTLQCASISITKTPDAASVSAGDQIGFVATVTNTGDGTATGVAVNDNLPTNAGLVWSIDVSGSDSECSIDNGVLSCSFGDLAKDASKHVHITSPTTAATCGTVNNTASASTTNDGKDDASASVAVNCPTLTITKSPDKTDDPGYTVDPGGTATFAIMVKNTGQGDATGVMLTDTLPAGLTWTPDNATDCSTSSITDKNGNSAQLLTCDIGALVADASFTVHVSATVPTDFVLDPGQAVGPLDIDGNLTDGAGIDWQSSGIDCATRDGCDIDLSTGSSDNSFGKGTKEDTEVPAVVSGSIPNNKSDLLRFYVTDRKQTVNSAVHDFLYLAWERVQAPNGTTNMDFELNQSDQASGNGVTPVRTAGDILIKYDLAKGGTTPTLGYHTWLTAVYAVAHGLGSAADACEGSNSFPCWGKVKELSGSAVSAEINTGSVTDPIAPNAGRTLDPLTFGEAGIDLQAAGIFQSGVCTNFGQAYLKSRSSDSFTSEIKDFIAPIPIEVSNCSPKLIDNTAWADATNLSTDPVSDAGQIKVLAQTSASSGFVPAGHGLKLAPAGLPLDAGIAVASTQAMATDAPAEAWTLDGAHAREPVDAAIEEAPARPWPVVMGLGLAMAIQDAGGGARPDRAPSILAYLTPRSSSGTGQSSG